VVLYSTSYTAAIPGLMAEFDVASQTVATLGLTSYLLGLAAGSVVVAPMSELYGRRVVYLVCMALFVVLIVPCALARSLGVMIGVRFVGCVFVFPPFVSQAFFGWSELTVLRAVFGAAMISNSPGTVVDIAGPESLALCMSWYSIAPLNGPVTGPLIGGFVYENLGWRWENWLAMILAGVAVLMLALVRETYAPTLAKRKAARLRRQTGDDRWWCRHEDQRISTLALLRVNLSRPFVLAATEPILWFFNIWSVTPPKNKRENGRESKRLTGPGSRSSTASSTSASSPTPSSSPPTAAGLSPSPGSPSSASASALSSPSVWNPSGGASSTAPPRKRTP
jgi:MFS family permease